MAFYAILFLLDEYKLLLIFFFILYFFILHLKEQLKLKLMFTLFTQDIFSWGGEMWLKEKEKK